MQGKRGFISNFKLSFISIFVIGYLLSVRFFPNPFQYRYFAGNIYHHFLKYIIMKSPRATAHTSTSDHWGFHVTFKKQPREFGAH
jgi:hypothetical protein